MKIFTEDFSECWRKRYGKDPEAVMENLTPLLRHRSVRRYSDQPVSETLVRNLVAAAHSASTSSTLQLWSVISVLDPDRRDALARLCADYDHVRNAPWFFCFVADHHRLRMAAEKVGEGALGLEYMEFLLMAVIDTALAAERMACAAELNGLGVCYIGALRNNAPAVKDLLGLPKGVFGVFGMTLGYPAADLDAEIKPRLSQENVWFKEQYQTEPGIGDYDERMSAFYLSQRMKGEITWSMRSGRRVDEHHMTGREILKMWLESEGFSVN